jgi:hypothetical protein
MATQNPTLTDLSCVLIVVELTTAKNAKKKATCVLYGGNQPAKYKGCKHYHNLIKGNNTLRNNTPRTSPANTNIYEHNIHHNV